MSSREISRSRSRSTRRITSSLISPVFRSSTTALRSASSSSRRMRWNLTDRRSISRRRSPDRYGLRSGRSGSGTGRGAVPQNRGRPLPRRRARRGARAPPRQRRMRACASSASAPPSSSSSPSTRITAGEREALRYEGHEHDGEREEDDQLSTRKGRARVSVQRDEERCRDRHGASHAVPPDEGRICPRR